MIPTVAKPTLILPIFQCMIIRSWRSHSKFQPTIPTTHLYTLCFKCQMDFLSIYLCLNAFTFGFILSEVQNFFMNQHHVSNLYKLTVNKQFISKYTVSQFNNSSHYYLLQRYICLHFARTCVDLLLSMAVVHKDLNLYLDFPHWVVWLLVNFVEPDFED